MLIIGAKGHAREILDVIEKSTSISDIFFYDDYSIDAPDTVFDKYPVLKNIEEARVLFLTDKRFVLGLGGVQNRFSVFEKFIKIGGVPETVVSHTATVGTYNVKLDKGLNIMHHVSIFNDVCIGTGTLINSFASIHHDCKIGEFCEISPGARILGRVKLGNFVSIGANASVLPDLIIGNNVTIGAGAVVTKNIPDNETWVGVPAKKIR